MNPRILVYWTTTDDAAAAGLSIDSLATGLPPEIVPQILKQARASDRYVGLLSRLLLIRAISKLGAGTIADIRINQRGRPYLPGSSDFSISHTEGLACVAASIGCRVGADVEAIRTVEPGLFDRVLADSERHFVCAADDPTFSFLRLWTMKEAAAKWDGRGLGIDPRKIVCGVDAASGSHLTTGVVHCKLAALDLPSGWTGHVAFEPQAAPRIDVFRYNFG